MCFFFKLTMSERSLRVKSKYSGYRGSVDMLRSACLLVHISVHEWDTRQIYPKMMWNSRFNCVFTIWTEFSFVSRFYPLEQGQDVFTCECLSCKYIQQFIGSDFILRTEFRIKTVHAWFKLRMVIFWFELFEGVSLVDVYVNFGTPIRVCQILVFLLFNFRADFIVDRIFYRWWDCAFLLFSRVARSNLRHEKMTRRQKSSHNCLETSVIVWKWYEVKIFKMSI